MKIRWLILVSVLLCLGAQAQASPLRGCIGTYDAPPRRADGRVDVPKLIAELMDLGANTYNFLIAHNTDDWDDLKLFLPRARDKNIAVWVTLLPPSESPPHGKRYSEPFRLDFDAWAEALAKLSLGETNLVAWSIDDFFHNENFYRPDSVKHFLETGRRINPRLAFVPCWYFRQIKPETAAKYRGLFDGVLFPYRAESQTTMNLTNATRVETEVRSIREIVGPNLPVILDVYATAHSRLGASTTAYVREVVNRGLRCCDGVLIYCHQNPVANADKYRVIRREFWDWRSHQAGKRSARGDRAAADRTPEQVSP
jgi:hypothetical protein